jgi:hypothetical protein
MFLPSEGCYRSIKKNEDTYTLYFAVQGLMVLKIKLSTPRETNYSNPQKPSKLLKQIGRRCGHATADHLQSYNCGVNAITLK